MAKTTKTKAKGKAAAGAAPQASPAVQAAIDKAVAHAANGLDPTKVQALTIGISLSCVRFGNRREGDLEQVDTHGTDPAMVEFSKRLMRAKELSAIEVLDARAQIYLRSVGLPSFFRPGTHRIPIALVDEVEEKLAAFAADRVPLVNTFCDRLPALIETMRQPLGPQFNLADYPTPAAARARFAFDWRWFEVDGAPGRLQAVSSAAFASARKKIEASMMDVAIGCRQALRAACLEIVKEIRLRLTPKDGEEARKFRQSSLLADLSEFFRTFEIRNVTDDAALAGVVAQLRGLTEGADLDQIKTDAALQAAFRTQIDAVAASLDGLLVPASARAIVLEG